MDSSDSMIRVRKAQKRLDLSIKIWFAIASVGLVVFSCYLIGHYVWAGVNGNFESWSKMSLKGYVDGDGLGNFIFAAHILMAIIISLGGLIQLDPSLRKRSMRLHRWNGSLYIVTVILIALGGLYLVWIRGAVTTLVGSLKVSLNATLMIYFGVKCWLAARSKEILTHRKWALRTFIVANGVWFFRVGFMAWIMINQGPRWSTENLDGPFDKFWAFGNFLIPLFILELYFKLSEEGTVRAKNFFTLAMVSFCLITTIGIIAAYLFMWRPAMG